MKDFNNKTKNNAESIINYCKNNFDKETNKYFKRSSIVDLITKYELYYHISLGNYAFETLMDLDETVKKLQELNLYVTVDMALFNIYKIIEENKEDKDLEKNLEELIRKRASLHALNDFVISDKELLGAEYYKKSKKEAILKDRLFSENMKSDFETNYQRTYEHYNLVINDELVTKIQDRINQ